MRLSRIAPRFASDYGSVVSLTSRLSNNAKFRLSVLLLCGVAIVASLQTTPSVRPAVLEHYKHVNRRGGDPTVESERAAAQVLKFGSNAVPTLVHMLTVEPTASDRVLERLAEWGHDRWGWEYHPEDRLNHERYAALAAVELLGSNAVGTLPVLERAFWKPWQMEMELRALAALGKPALPIFLCGLTNSDAAIRYGAVVGLSSLGSEARSAYPELLRLTTDPDARVREQLTLALGRTAGSLADLVRDIAPLLRDAEREVRFSAAMALWLAARPRRANEPGMAEGAALIASALAGSDKSVCRLLLRAIQEFKEAAAPHIPALLRLLDDSDEGVRVVAINVLGQLKLEPTVAIPALASRLATSTGESRTRIAVALRAFGDAVEKVQPGLLESLGTLGKLEFEAEDQFLKEHREHEHRQRGKQR